MDIFQVAAIIIFSFALVGINLQDFGQGTVAFNQPAPEEASSAAKERCDDASGPRTDKLTCYSKFFGELTKKYGHSYAFDVLFALQKQDVAALNCHVIAHKIGHEAYQLAPQDWKNQLRQINLECTYGAMHGLLEAHAGNSGGKIDEKELAGVCGDRPACIHAAGHLLLLETRNYLDKAIDLCAAFPRAKLHRHYCLTGVYMERMIAPNLAAHELVPKERREKWYLLIDDFEKMCRSYEGENATACWTEIIHASVIKFKGDPKQVFDFCNSAQVGEGQYRCRRHAIGDLASWKKLDMSSLAHMCSLEQPNDPDFEEDCYTGLVGTTISGLPLSEAGDVVEFCASRDGKFQGACFGHIGYLLNRRGIPAGERTEFCRNAPAQFRDLCTGNKIAQAAVGEKDVHGLE